MKNLSGVSELVDEGPVDPVEEGSRPAILKTPDLAEDL